MFSVGGLDVETLTTKPTAAFPYFVLQKLDDMNMHALWLTAFLLNPGMRNFPFLVYLRNRNSSMTAAKTIRCFDRRLTIMMSKKLSSVLYEVRTRSEPRF